MQLQTAVRVSCCVCLLRLSIVTLSEDGDVSVMCENAMTTVACHTQTEAQPGCSERRSLLCAGRCTCIEQHCRRSEGHCTDTLYCSSFVEWLHGCAQLLSHQASNQPHHLYHQSLVCVSAQHSCYNSPCPSRRQSHHPCARSRHRYCSARTRPEIQRGRSGHKTVAGAAAPDAAANVQFTPAMLLQQQVACCCQNCPCVRHDVSTTQTPDDDADDDTNGNLLHNDLALHASTLVGLAVVAVAARGLEGGAGLLSWGVQVVLVAQSLSVLAALLKRKEKDRRER